MSKQELIYKKGDRRYLLILDNDIYHFTKMIKKRLKNGLTKTTKVIVSDFSFSSLSELSLPFLIDNGLKENEINVIPEMVNALTRNKK